MSRGVSGPLSAPGAVVCDLFGRPFHVGTDVSARWSDVVAATPELAERLIETVRSTLPTPKGGATR